MPHPRRSDDITRAPSRRCWPPPATWPWSGCTGKWTSKEISEKFGYKYSDQELDEWAGQVRRLAEDAEVTHVLFNNCYRDWAHVNA